MMSESKEDTERWVARDEFFLTATQAARRLSTTERGVEVLIERKQIGAIQVDGAYRIPAPAVEAYLRRKATYELWDLGTGNAQGAYPSMLKALIVVRDVLARDGDDALRDLCIVEVGTDGSRGLSAHWSPVFSPEDRMQMLEELLNAAQRNLPLSLDMACRAWADSAKLLEDPEARERLNAPVEKQERAEITEKGLYHCVAEWSSTEAGSAEEAAHEFVLRMLEGSADILLTVLPDHHAPEDQMPAVSLRAVLQDLLTRLDTAEFAQQHPELVERVRKGAEGTRMPWREAAEKAWGKRSPAQE